MCVCVSGADHERGGYCYESTLAWECLGASFSESLKSACSESEFGAYNNFSLAGPDPLKTGRKNIVACCLYYYMYNEIEVKER